MMNSREKMRNMVSETAIYWAGWVVKDRARAQDKSLSYKWRQQAWEASLRAEEWVMVYVRMLERMLRT